jgi:hypothetical protein
VKKCLISSVIVLASATALNASATPIDFPGDGIGPNGIPVSAVASVDVSGGDMIIVLTNTSPAHSGADVPGSTLTGFFWRFKDGSNPALTPFSATVAAGSSILGTCGSANCIATTNVGGEFGFAYQASGFPRGTNWGIASSGYLSTGLTGNLGNFGGFNLDNPVSLDGINFGIVSNNSYSPNGGLSNIPVIQNSVRFVLHGAQSLTIENIQSLEGNFQYGTSFTELNVLDAPFSAVTSAVTGVVAEPASVALMALGLLSLGAGTRRHKKMAPSESSSGALNGARTHAASSHA